MMKRLILHWTAGTNQPCTTDYEHYHYLVTGDGLVVKGKYAVLDNENCTDGRYAAHCGGGNTGSIGVSMCGMHGFKDWKNLGKYPITRVQFERCCKLCAELCKKYGLLPTPDMVMTHYEFGLKHPNTSSAGKIDIICLPPYMEVEKNKVGDFIRNKIRWYMTKI